MGACGSSGGGTPEERTMEKKINAEIAKASRKDKAQVKMLLLGAGSSGKTTIFKQMRILYGAGFDETGRKSFCPVIRRSVIADMQTLVSNLESLGTELFTDEAEAAVDALMAFDVNSSFKQNTDNFSDEMKSNLACFWVDAGVQEGYTNRGKLQLNDTFPFYMHNFETVCREDWMPSVADVLNARVRTSGIVEETYNIEGVEFAMFDVGGQRNERKKWIHCFENVTAVIFVAAISEYNQVLFEDESTNRIVESVNLFGKTATEKWFQNTSMILFLNKSDLFEMKLLRDQIPIQQEDAGLFMDYQGGCDLAAATEYMKQKFLDAAKVGDDGNAMTKREIFPHVTCATNTDNVAHVFAACREIINRSNMAASGFTA